MSEIKEGQVLGNRYKAIKLIGEGGTLEDRLQRARFTLAETDRFFSQLAAALDYAHKQKIVHRDLKLANVLVDQNDNIQLSDFGSSKLLEDSVHLTQTGTAENNKVVLRAEAFLGTNIVTNS